MLLDLACVWRIDKARSLMIGDRETDLQAARTAGIHGELLPNGERLDAFVQPLLCREDRDGLDLAYKNVLRKS